MYQDLVVIGADGSGKTTLANAIAGHGGFAKSFKLFDGIQPGIRGGAIVVISVPEGVEGKTRTDVAAAKAAGLGWVVLYLNKVDLIAPDDSELIDLVEMECREMANKYGFDGHASKVVRGAATTRPALDELLAACSAKLTR